MALLTRYFYNLLKIKSMLLLAFVVLLEILGTYVLYICRRKNVKLEYIVLVLTIILGIGYIVSIPIGAVPDERAHFKRAYEVSEGYLITPVDKNNDSTVLFPVEIESNFFNPDATTHSSYKVYFSNIVKKDSGKKMKTSYKNTSLYPFLCYLPQAIGIMIGRTLNLSILACAYLGRLMNLIVWCFTIFFSIRLIPYFKKTLAFIAFLPITLQEVTSLAADSLTIAACVLFVSYVLHLYYDKRDQQITVKNFAVLALSGLCIALCKIVYIPLLLLILIIPSSRYKDKKTKYISNILLIGAIVAIELIWVKMCSIFLVEYTPGVNSGAQTLLVLQHPIYYCKALFASLISNGEFYINGFTGSSLEHFTVNLAGVYHYICIILLLLVGIKENKEAKKLSDLALIKVIVSVLLTTVLIFTALYIQWTPYHKEIIDGVQGRYFIPFIILIPFIFANRKKPLLENNKHPNNLLFMYFFTVNLYALTLIMNYHI